MEGAIATLHLICGLPCSGKTTLSRRLERERGALRLTPDEWHLRLFGQDLADDRHDDRHDAIESLLWELAVRALSLGTDVALDFGFWSREERERFRREAADHGAASEVHFLDVSIDELLARLQARNGDPDAFLISESHLRTWHSWFEPPAADELLRREPCE